MNIMTLRVSFLCKDVAVLVVYMYSENAFINMFFKNLLLYSQA